MSILEPPDTEHCTSTSTDDASSCCPTVSCDDPPTCRPALPRMKSCLKSSPSHSGACTPTSDDDSKGLSLTKKRVAFSEDGTEEVYEADEWDRTPAEIAQRLTYEDVLELKMIQRELPRAEQPCDPLSSRPYSSVFLAHVPIPLLPLNPVTVSAAPSPTPSPSTVSSGTASPPCSPWRSSSPPPPSRASSSSISTARDFNPPRPCTPPPLVSSSPPLSSSSIFAPDYGPTPPRPRHSPPPPPPSSSKSNDALAIKPHNIPVPPPPPPPRPTYPPPPPSVQSRPTSNLPPPKRTFTFLPLLDESSSNSTSAPSTPVRSGATTARAGSPMIVRAPQATHPDTITPSSSSQSQHWDSDRSDLGYTSDCSVDASTPSLTTASLASSSPPESPGIEYDFHVTESRAHLGLGSRGDGAKGSDDDDGNESFVLNLDLDTDVDPLDSYFPRMHPNMTMHPIHHQSIRSRPSSDLTPLGVASLHTPPKPMSRVPISSFHTRHPHLHTTRPTDASNSCTSTPPAKLPPPPNSNTRDIPDPSAKLRLRSIPSPELDLPAPSPLELPARIGASSTVMQKRMLVPLLPLAEPAPAIPLGVNADSGGREVNNNDRNQGAERAGKGVFFVPEEQGLLPSLSRTQVPHPQHL